MTDSVIQNLQSRGTQMKGMCKMRGAGKLGSLNCGGGSRYLTPATPLTLRAARFVFRDYKYTTSVTGLLERLQWPLLSTRRTNSRLTLFYKAAHDQAGISLDHLQKPLRNTRSADDTT